MTKVAIISHDGHEIKRINLTQNKRHYTFKVTPGSGQYNIIEVDHQRIRDKEDNTPDQIAVHTSWISETGQQSICLPHKLIIEIKEQDSRGQEKDTNSLVKP